MEFETNQKTLDSIKDSTKGYFDVYEGKVLTVDVLKKFVTRVADILKLETRVIAGSLQSLLSVPFTDQYVSDLLYKIVANKKTLKAGNALVNYPNLFFTCKEFIQFEKCVPTEGKFAVTFRVLTGHFALGRCTQLLKETALNRIAYTIGYSLAKDTPNRPNKYSLSPKDVPTCLIGLYAKATLIPNVGRVLTADNVIEDTSVVDYNRKNIIIYRNRYEHCKLDNNLVSFNCKKCTHKNSECSASYNM